MNKVLKMDLYRLVHSIVFYVCLGFITMMAVAIINGRFKPQHYGYVNGCIEKCRSGRRFYGFNDRYRSNQYFIGITLALFVSGDFTSGFIKIF